MKIHPVIAAAFLLLASLPAGRAYAGNACLTPHNDFDGLYCLNKTYQTADKDLNDAFGQLKGKLDPAGQKALRSSQLAWQRSRNESCSRHEGTSFFINLDCATRQTSERTEFLRSRYQECVAGSCDDGKLH